MKHASSGLAFVCLLITMYGSAVAAQSGPALVITAVFDGPLSGGQPKGIELYANADIQDLSEYGLQAINESEEASAAWTLNWRFPIRSVTAGEFLYIVNQRPAFYDYFGVATDYGTIEMSINGDDAIALFHEGDLIDLFGDPGTVNTPGESWNYKDGFAYRASGSSADATFIESNYAYSGEGALVGCETSTNVSCHTTIPLGSYSPTVLPVELQNLLAESSSTGARVSWTAATQRDNDYFAVEVSDDGVAFAEAGRVDGDGTTTESVDYVFDYPTDAVGLHYFRLRQVDLDGSPTTSDTVTATLGQGASGLRVVGAGGAGGRLEVATNGATQLMVTNAVGAVVQRYTLAESGTLVLEIDHLVPGVYVVSDGRTGVRFIR